MSYSTSSETVHEIIRRAETQYISGRTKLGVHVDFSMYDTIEKILAYVHSKFTSGEKDSLGREKPFFNIVTAAINIWYRATDIDRKNISIAPDKSGNVLGAFLGTIKLKEWMKVARFGVYLNKWGRTLAKYGSAVTKIVEKDGELNIDVIPWNRLICDPQDFDALPRIEKLYFTPAQLRKKEEYNETLVEQLITAKTTRKTIGRFNKDYMAEFIEVYEVHGELSQEAYKKAKNEEVKEGDDKLFFQQMHVVSYYTTDKSKSGKKEYEDITLYVGKEKYDPYSKDDLIEEDGRTLSIGAVEYLFDPQWMVNHSMKTIKDTLDIAGKIAFQTSDKRFLNRNLLREFETGDVFIHDINQPLTLINNSKGDIASLQNFVTQWRVLGQEITSTPDAMRGKNPPSNTPWSTVERMVQEGYSLFEVMIENKALALEEKLRTRIIPFLKTKLDTDEEVMETLEDNEIQKIDAMYIPVAAINNYNQRTIEDILNQKPVQPFNQQAEQQLVKQSLAPLGNKRAFRPTVVKDGKEVSVTWKEILKDLEWKLDIDISGESKDKATLLQTLTQTFQTIVSLAGRPMTPDERLVFNKIMNEAGTVSPVELSVVSSVPTTPNIEELLNKAGVGNTTGRTPVGVTK